MNITNQMIPVEGVRINILAEENVIMETINVVAVGTEIRETEELTFYLDENLERHYEHEDGWGFYTERIKSKLLDSCYKKRNKK